MKEFDLIVIGAGPGGYPCAIRAAQLGKKTAIVEKTYFGGVCLNVGCIPSKALIHAASQFHKMKHEASEMGIESKSVSINVEQLQKWKSGVVKKLTGGVSQLLKRNGVELIEGEASFKDAHTLSIKGKSGTETIKAKSIVIATGSSVVEIPSMKFNGKNVISSTEALDLKELPKQLVVIGGGFIGLEIGIVYAKLGSEVTVVEAMDNILPNIDQELVNVVKKRMKKLGIEIFTKAKALGIKESDPAKEKKLHLEIQTDSGEKKTLEATHLMVSVGRKPNSKGLGLESIGVKTDDRGNILTDNQSRTNVEGVFAIGDVAGAPQLAHRATMDGLLVAETVAGHSGYKDYKTVPWAVFCDPEIAVCGLTEDEAKEKGFKVKIGKFPFAASGRALSTNESDGFVKVLIDESTDMLLGAHIVGPEASNLIAEAALAIEMGATAEDIIRTIHTHPTLPEAFPEAIEAAMNKAIHIYKPARPSANAEGTNGRSARP